MELGRSSAAIDWQDLILLEWREDLRSPRRALRRWNRRHRRGPCPFVLRSDLPDNVTDIHPIVLLGVRSLTREEAVSWIDGVVSDWAAVSPSGN